MASENTSALGIIAGGGQLPALLVEACRAENRPCFVLCFNEADTIPLAHAPHAVVRIGAVGEALTHLHNAHVGDIVMAGKIKRPSIVGLRPDKVGAKLLARLGGAFFSGDDSLLKAMVTFLEEEGFRVVGSDEVLTNLLTPEGVLGKIRPGSQAKADIQHGMRVAKRLGELDIGQAVIVENEYVLGVEAAEGTDALITRCGGLRQAERGGVLVKIKKPGQDGRVDLPTIGVQTVEKMHEAGFSGIAVEADGSLMLDRAGLIARADELGIFVIGMRHE